MKREIRFLLILVSVITILVACTTLENQEDIPNQTAGSVQSESTLPESFLELSMDFESFYSVTLTDLISGEELASFEVEEGNLIHGIFHFDDSYFALLVGYGTFTSGVFETPENEMLRYLIFDEGLNVIEEIFIADEYLQNSFRHFRTHVFFENNELIVYYVVDWMQAYWSGEPQSLRRYNAHTGETKVLFEVEDENLSINQFWRVNDHIFAFTGSYLDDEINLYYGWIDLTANEMIVFSEPFNLGKVTTAGAYVLLAEGIDSPNARLGIFEVTRGEVIVLNVETGDQRFIPLDGLESNLAQISFDGRHIVTFDEYNLMLKKYDINSGELVLEQAISIEGDVLETIIPLTSNSYLIISGNRDSDGTFYREILTTPEVIE